MRANQKEQYKLRHKVRVIETGVVYESISACAKAIGGTTGNISECLSTNYKRKTCKGYHFEYVLEDDSRGYSEGTIVWLHFSPTEERLAIRNNGRWVTSRGGVFQHFSWGDDDDWVKVTEIIREGYGLNGSS